MIKCELDHEALIEELSNKGMLNGSECPDCGEPLILSGSVKSLLSNFPMRIQITCYGKLIAELICPSTLADKMWARYTQNCDAKNIPSGGAIMQRSDLPRYWNVPVGSDLCEERK